MDKQMYLKISRPQNVCVRCGATIAEAGKHPSAIFEAEEKAKQEDESPLRQDYCSECWGKLNEKEYFSFWMARREKPKVKKIQTRKQRNATLLSYFDFLYQKNDPEYAQHLFFLAHLLMKFSVFRWLKSEPATEPDGEERIVFRNTATDDVVTITAVSLDEQRLVEIKREIDEFLARATVAEEPAAQS